jgi:hypothetical protein
MKYKLFLFVFCLLGLTSLQAQNNIVEALETPVANEGVIDIESDSDITALLGKPNSNVTVNSDNYNTIKTTGFRIQVFMGNDPKRSKKEATDKRTLIQDAFSDTETYITYESPNWKVLVGDFITREEAILFKEILQKEFPKFGREMYIVTNTINIPVEKAN